MRGLIKELRILIKKGKKAETEKLLPQVYKAIDKTAKKGLIKKGNASRKKSRLTKAINKITASKLVKTKKTTKPKTKKAKSPKATKNKK